MNERIRELAEHCDFYVGNEHYNESHEEKQRLWVEKFAELIIKECADTAFLEANSRKAQRAVLQRFGVE